MSFSKQESQIQVPREQINPNASLLIQVDGEIVALTAWKDLNNPNKHFDREWPVFVGKKRVRPDSRKHTVICARARFCSTVLRYRAGPLAMHPSRGRCFVWQ